MLLLMTTAAMLQALPVDIAALRKATFERLADAVHTHPETAALRRLTCKDPPCGT
ncbi:hypothetical protein ACCQ13_14330 [Xanthomonas sp. NCPPB 1638]|nr:hypothetical protein [Xanthomonas cucurbitae]WDM74501.1 hypothetical protein K6982_13995 [Xanthomonas cucurbitae]WDM83736.1 hypothetical protein K6979_04880 [Xanthomonas cucurbitae]